MRARLLWRHCFAGRRPPRRRPTSTRSSGRRRSIAARAGPSFCGRAQYYSDFMKTNDGGNVRVLLIEDDVEVRQGVRSIRAPQSPPVRITTTATGAWLRSPGRFRRADRRYRLAETRRFQRCRAGRRGGDQTPMLMLTARDAVEGRRCRLNHQHADDYLIKPFVEEELHAAVARYAVDDAGTGPVRQSWSGRRFSVDAEIGGKPVSPGDRVPEDPRRYLAATGRVSSVRI